jgi:DNA-binding MarR family transcriptional regulator
MPAQKGPTGRYGIAFLLAQLGALAADRYAAALRELEVAPPLAGIMRTLQADPGLSQQQLADRLGTPPSRIVGYIDELESRGWLTRSRDTADRRVNVLALTDQGRDAFAAVAGISRAHEERITESLTDAEHSTLRILLDKLAEANGLVAGVHPGYRRA